MNTEDVKNLIGKSITWKLGNNPRDEYYGVVLASSQDRKWVFVKMPPQNKLSRSRSSLDGSG